MIWPRIINMHEPGPVIVYGALAGILCSNEENLESIIKAMDLKQVS
jgi:hypothetical protein